MRQSTATATRLSCFAIITAIELDIRKILTSLCMAHGIKSVLPTDVRANAIARRNKDERATNFDPGSDDDDSLIDYTDFFDLSKILNRHSALFASDTRTWIKALADQIERNNPARARVCHSRPLEPDDYASLLDLADFSVKNVSNFSFLNVKETIDALSTNPSSVFSLQIPAFWGEDNPQVANNLPLPDFDDTGFLGRSNDRTSILRHLKGAHPVISILGEGGVGKTSLALRCAYDLADDPESSQFEYIVWVSLKTTKLTASGIQPIRDAITTALHLWREVSMQLGTPQSLQQDAQALFQEIYDYLSTFRILLILDNCETVTKHDLLGFLSGIPAGSKVLMTSRLGLGALELPYPLEAMLPKDSAALLRVYARILNNKSLYAAELNQIEKYIKKLYNNPLAIKWFVASVAKGGNPKRLLNKKESSFLEILEFCFENVFECFTTEQKLVVDTLLCAGRPLSSTELIILLGKSDKDLVELALSTLHHTSVVRRNFVREGSNNEEVVYQVADFAQQYIRRKSPPSSEFRRELFDRLQELKALEQSSNTRQAAYKYEQFAVRAYTRGDRLVAAELNRVLDLARKKHFEAAFELVSSLEKRFPDSSELFRVKAQALAENQRLFEAEQAFEDSIAANDESEITRYSFSLFLLNELNDPDRALTQAKCLAEIDSDHFAPKALLAATLTRCGQYEQATAKYQEVVDSWEEQPARIAVINHDQASNCWRKWAAQDRNHKDGISYRRHIREAMRILALALSRGLKDSKLLNRIEHLCNDAIAGATFFRDLDLAKNIVKFLETIKPMIHRIIDIQNLDEFQRVFSENKELDYALAKLPVANARGKTFSSTERTDSERLSEEAHGVIDRIIVDKHFGFINTDAGSELFFHKNTMLTQELWSNSLVGSIVRFAIGENNQGRCAVEVVILGPTALPD